MSPKQVFADSVASQNELWRITRVLEHECSVEKASAEVDDDSDTKQEERDDPKKGGDDGEFAMGRSQKSHLTHEIKEKVLRWRLNSSKHPVQTLLWWRPSMTFLVEPHDARADPYDSVVFNVWPVRQLERPISVGMEFSRLHRLLRLPFLGKRGVNASWLGTLFGKIMIENYE